MVEYKDQYVCLFLWTTSCKDMNEYPCWDLTLHHRGKDLVSKESQELVDTNGPTSLGWFFPYKRTFYLFMNFFDHGSLPINIS